MRILVCGGQDFDNYALVSKTLHSLFPPSTDDISTWLPPPDTVIIHGAARGADTLADQWAVVNWVKIEEYPADWDKLGGAAGPIRNQRMLDEGKPDVVVAFPGGRGTADMVRRSRAAGVRVIEVSSCG
jgi:hypothetical protein